MDGEDIGHLDVKGRLCSRVKIVELVDVEGALSGWNVNHYMTSVRFIRRESKILLTVTPGVAKSFNRFSNIAVEWL